MLLAGALSLLSLFFSMRAYWRCRRLSAAALGTDEDELERQLALRERALELTLSTRSVQVLGRASLFGGTGGAVWQLSGGSSQYLAAGMAFGLGFVGWAGCSELQRRIGSLAGTALGARRAGRGVRPRRPRTEVDPPTGSG